MNLQNVNNTIMEKRSKNNKNNCNLTVGCDPGGLIGKLGRWLGGCREAGLPLEGRRSSTLASTPSSAARFPLKEHNLKPHEVTNRLYTPTSGSNLGAKLIMYGFQCLVDVQVRATHQDMSPVSNPTLVPWNICKRYSLSQSVRMKCNEATPLK